MKISVVFPDAFRRLVEAPDPEDIRLEWMEEYGRSLLSIGQAAKNYGRHIHGIDQVDDLIGSYVENRRAVEYAFVPILVSQSAHPVRPVARWIDIDNKIALTIAELGLEQAVDSAYRECLTQYYLLRSIHGEGVSAITKDAAVLAVIAVHPTP